MSELLQLQNAVEPGYVEEESFGWGANQAVIGDWSKARKHPARLMFQKSNYTFHTPQRLGHVSGQEKKWWNQLHQAAQAAAKKIQIKKILHAATEMA